MPTIFKAYSCTLTYLQASLTKKMEKNFKPRTHCDRSRKNIKLVQFFFLTDRSRKNFNSQIEKLVASQVIFVCFRASLTKKNEKKKKKISQTQNTELADRKIICQVYFFPHTTIRFSKKQPDKKNWFDHRWLELNDGALNGFVLPFLTTFQRRKIINMLTQSFKRRHYCIALQKNIPTLIRFKVLV